MDSITQFVLGAAVSTACLGKAIGPRKAALMGGLLGTLPDLDVFIPFDDPVDSFVYHRGWSHSVFVHALVTPVLAEGLIRLVKSLRDHRKMTYVAVFLCLFTHAIIDAMTVYGTRIFWPLYPDPVGIGSVFIIDPLYSLPLLAIVIWAVCKRSWTEPFGKSLAAVLLVTTGYLGLSVGVQKYVEAQAHAIFERSGEVPIKIYAIAAPFNIALWKVIGLDEHKYQNLYYSLFDGEQPIEIYEHNRHPELVACLSQNAAFHKLEWFSRGYYRAELVGNKIVVSDLRMGLTPGYAFRFAIAEKTSDGYASIVPERDLTHRRSEPEDLSWLADRLLGIPAVRAAEARLQPLPDTVSGSSCSVG